MQPADHLKVHAGTFLRDVQTGACGMFSLRWHQALVWKLNHPAGTLLEQLPVAGLGSIGTAGWQQTTGD